MNLVCGRRIGYRKEKSQFTAGKMTALRKKYFSREYELTPKPKMFPIFGRKDTGRK